MINIYIYAINALSCNYPPSYLMLLFFRRYVIDDIANRGLIIIHVIFSPFTALPPAQQLTAFDPDKMGQPPGSPAASTSSRASGGERKPSSPGSSKHSAGGESPSSVRRHHHGPPSPASSRTSSVAEDHHGGFRPPSTSPPHSSASGHNPFRHPANTYVVSCAQYLPIKKTFY